MMSPTCLITGATGFVGSHVAEACQARGWTVRAPIRPTSNTALLERLGAQLVRGDLSDAASVQAAVDGIDLVCHCAAKVGDWGAAADYRTVNVEGLRTLLEACRGRPLRRFVHLSSLGVYEARNHHGTEESEPLPTVQMDGYTQTKMEAEQLALQYHREQGVPVTVLRPGFIYGPRDRTLLPKLIENLRGEKVRWLGGGRGALNTIYVANLVDAIFLTVGKTEAIGQVYNLTDGEVVSKRRFIEAIVTGLDLPPVPSVGLPLWLARPLAKWMEKKARRQGAVQPPRLTQARVKFLGLNLDFSIAKARRELGYQPRFSFEQGIRETIAWYRQNGKVLNMETVPHQPPEPNAGTAPGVASPPPPPVRIKVYGLIPLTRRGYLLCQAGGVVLLLVLLVLWALFIAPKPMPPQLALPWRLVLENTPLIFLVVVLLEGVETFVVLRRFRRAEAQRPAGAHEVPSEGK